MKVILPVLAVISLAATAIIASAAHADVTSLYDIKADTLAGQPADLAQYRGKLALVVNVASKCGFTPQYKGLEALYEKYKDKGFVILGFPSNDFHEQEPGTADDIQKFCKLNYGVTFPLFKKGPVTGDAKQPVYAYLVAHTPEKEPGEVKWNFEKFLVGPDGKVIDRWRSKVDPSGSKIADAVEANLPKNLSKVSAK